MIPTSERRSALAVIAAAAGPGARAPRRAAAAGRVAVRRVRGAHWRHHMAVRGSCGLFVCGIHCRPPHMVGGIQPAHPYAIAHAPYVNSAVRRLFPGCRDHWRWNAGPLHEERELARTDPLTGLGNRRFFADLAAIEISRTRRYHRSLTLAYIDVDRFKSVNDKLGHAAGDALLVKVAEVLGKHLRTSDLMARVGGDEFARFCPRRVWRERRWRWRRRRQVSAKR